MEPKVVLKIDALDNTKQAFSSVKKNLEGVEKSTKAFGQKIEALQPTFRKMAVAGTAAFAAIGAGIYKTTQNAAVAEGSWNKFNTVFGEGADEMRAFINDIRKEMPSATHEIARMGADLQDLLVPMGLAREEAQGLTMGFLDVANKVAAFNDVDPTQVLEAFKSGLAGSSEPLRRFGINALESSIEMEALETGLLQVGQKLTDLDPIARSQVKAQALLTLSVKQSADAINGFEANNDSLIRRQQDLQARISELSVTLGNMFLPILDEVTKAILPLVTRLSEWTEANPELARNIIIGAGAVAGLVAVLGTLGLVLIPLIAAFKAIAVVILALSGPVGLIVLALGALGFAAFKLWQNWDVVWENIKKASVVAYEWIKSKTIDPLIAAFDKVMAVIRRVQSAMESISGGARNVTSRISSSVKSTFSKITPFADGGIVTRPTLGLVGEAGPEAIIPLSRPNALAGVGGGQTFVFNVQGDITDRVKDSIMRELRRQVRL